MVVWSRSSVSLTSLTELSWMERLTEDSVLFDSDTRTDGCRWKGVESVLWIQSICYRHRLFCFAGSGSSSYKKVDFNLSNICLTTRHSPHKKTIFQDLILDIFFFFISAGAGAGAGDDGPSNRLRFRNRNTGDDMPISKQRPIKI